MNFKYEFPNHNQLIISKINKLKIQMKNYLPKELKEDS